MTYLAAHMLAITAHASSINVGMWRAAIQPMSARIPQQMMCTAVDIALFRRAFPSYSNTWNSV